MRVPVNYAPRDYQQVALTALDNGITLAVWCWSRRGGKDKTAFAYGVKKMVERPMNVVLVFPTKEQGKNSFWENVENDGFKTIDAIPEALIERKDNSNMRIVLKNGSTFQVLGATDPDALRGANGRLYIFSEFVDIPGAALDVIRPIVAVNGGQVIIQSTPKIDGISGGTFKILFDRALENWTNGKQTQFASLITADRYLSAEVLEELREECIAKNGNDFMWRQEYLCDWGQTSSASYYGAALKKMRDHDQIGRFPYDPAYPAYAAWDLGMSDSTAITMFQVIKKRPRIIDYYENHDIGDAAHVAFLKTKPYNFSWHFLPHDGSVRDSDAVQRIDKLHDLGLVNSSLLMREPVEDGIKRAVEELVGTDMNRATTEELCRKLQLYKRKFNPLTGDYMGPEHKTESHAADSVRYMFKAIHDEFDKATGEFLYSPENSQSDYETDSLMTAALYRP
jgi:phage terminase large subunit